METSNQDISGPTTLLFGKTNGNYILKAALRGEDLGITYFQGAHGGGNQLSPTEYKGGAIKDWQLINSQYRGEGGGYKEHHGASWGDQMNFTKTQQKSPLPGVAKRAIPELISWRRCGVNIITLCLIKNVLFLLHSYFPFFRWIQYSRQKKKATERVFPVNLKSSNTF